MMISNTLPTSLLVRRRSHSSYRLIPAAAIYGSQASSQTYVGPRGLAVGGQVLVSRYDPYFCEDSVNRSPQSTTQSHRPLLPTGRIGRSVMAIVVSMRESLPKIQSPLGTPALRTPHLRSSLNQQMSPREVATVSLRTAYGVYRSTLPRPTP